jgi:hypothetical protein
LIIIKDRVLLALKAIRKANRGCPVLEDNRPGSRISQQPEISRTGVLLYPGRRLFRLHVCSALIPNDATSGVTYKLV